MARTAMAGLLMLAAALGCDRAPPASVAAPADEPFVDVRAGSFRLPANGKGVALVFVGHDCPISNAYAPEIVRLQREFGSQGIAFVVVYADADLGRDAAREHADAYGFDFPALLDPTLRLARRVGATVKPEAAVLSAAGAVLYLGRIDDRYVDFGKRREHVTQRELRDALEALVAGRPVAVARAPAIGCEIDFPNETTR